MQFHYANIYYRNYFKITHTGIFMCIYKCKRVTVLGFIRFFFFFLSNNTVYKVARDPIIINHTIYVRGTRSHDCEFFFFKTLFISLNRYRNRKSLTSDDVFFFFFISVVNDRRHILENKKNKNSFDQVPFSNCFLKSGDPLSILSSFTGSPSPQEK